MNPDINGQLTAARISPPRAYMAGNGTQTSSGVDMRDFINNCKLCITHSEFSASGTTSIQYSVLDSADNTTFAASAYLPTVAANTAATAVIEIPIDTRNCKRYLQVKAVTTSTTATFDIGAVIIGLKQLS